MHQFDFLFPLWVIPACFLLISMAQPVFAHGGRTNAEGCHNNRKTGEYHCHGAGTISKVKTITPVATATGCERRPRCYELTSCADAMHYFRDCGLDRLDGDNDGVPCESICGHHAQN
jgi:hypothetical protein